MALDGDDMVVGERLQRAADDRAAGVKDRAELLLGELRAGRQAMIDDGVENAAVDRRGAPALAAPGAACAVRRRCGYVRRQHRCWSCCSSAGRKRLRALGPARLTAIVPARGEIAIEFCIQYRRNCRHRAPKLSARLRADGRLSNIISIKSSALSAEPAWHGRLLPMSALYLERHVSAMAETGNLELVHVTKRYGATLAVDAIDLRVRVRRLLLPARAVGLRQDLDPADDRRPRERQRRRHPDRRRQRDRPAARQARHGDDVPELRAVPASELPRQRRLLAEDARRRQGDAARARRWSSSSSSR